MNHEEELAKKRRDLVMWLDSFFQAYRARMEASGYTNGFNTAEKKRGEIKKMIHDWTPKTKAEQQSLFDAHARRGR